MGTGARKRRELPREVLGLQRRFDAWRQRRQRGTRIPDRLWTAAAKLASEHGLNVVAAALALDYYGLKKRAEMLAEESPIGASGSFVELPQSMLASVGTCGQAVIELQDGGGATLRISLTGRDALDVGQLTRQFWERC